MWGRSETKMLQREPKGQEVEAHKIRVRERVSNTEADWTRKTKRGRGVRAGHKRAKRQKETMDREEENGGF